MSIRIEGIDELNKRIADAKSEKVLRKPMHRAVLRIQRDMAKYPRQRNMSTTYRRTGTLGRRWTTKVKTSQGGARGVVGNNTRYAPWVQSERFQAGQHRNWWQTDEDVVTDNEDAIVTDFRKAIEDALDG